jgi:hypothetical protein
MIYQFECAVCEKPREFNMEMKDAPRVGTSSGLSREVTPEQDFLCACGANNWTRVWPSKNGGFRWNMRRTSIV